MKELLKALNKEKRDLNNRIDSLTTPNMSNTARLLKAELHGNITRVQTEINKLKKAIKEAK